MPIATVKKFPPARSLGGEHNNPPPAEPNQAKRRKARNTIVACALALLASASLCHGDQSDLKPGDIIGPENWQKVQGMAGENLLNRIRQGYTLKIKEPRAYRLPQEYLDATEKYSGQVKLGSNGELLNYVAGLPFPKFDSKDSQAGLEVACNFYWRWLGDDHKAGGATKTGKTIQKSIERDGSERRNQIIHHYIKTRSRVTLDSKHTIPGYEHIDWMQLRADEYPRDTSGITTLEIRYADPKREDDLYIYVPSIRRVRRAPPIQRCATLAPSEFNSDDINGFNGKIVDFNYKLLGESKALGNFSQQRLPFERKQGDYLPLEEEWEVRDAYVLEITPKDPTYCYPRKVLHIDKLNWESVRISMWDNRGNYWKEQIPFRTAVKLPDGREVISVGTVIIMNVQNGRSSLATAVRAYHQGYQPSLFTLATLQTVMRGGAIR